MRLRVQVVIEPDDDDQEPDGNRKATVVHEVATIERPRSERGHARDAAS